MGESGTKKIAAIMTVILTLLCGYAVSEDLPACVLAEINQYGEEPLVNSVELPMHDGKVLYAAWSIYRELYGYVYDPSTDTCDTYMEMSQPFTGACLTAGETGTPSFTLGNGTESITWTLREEDFVITGWTNADYTVTLENEEYLFVSTDNGTGTRVERTSNLWLMSYEDLPHSPEKAAALTAISSEAAETMLPGFTLCSYESYNGGDEANAWYARLTENGLLQLSALSLKSGEGITKRTDSMMIPVTEWFRQQCETTPLKEMINADTLSDTFRFPDQTLDIAAVPVNGQIIEADLQSRFLALITQEEDGRHLVIVTEANGQYQAACSQVMPENLYMDTFHNTDGEISLEWGSYGDNGNWDGWQASWVLDRQGTWRLQWVMPPSNETWAPNYGYVYVYGAWQDRLCGELDVPDLMDGHFEELPDTVDDLMARIDTTGWAVVNNPDPEDRLYLRKSPARGAEALGKFWNGTVFRVLETKGDWCRVEIGTNGVLEGWMMKKYLTFGSDMNSVFRPYRDYELKESILTTSSVRQTWTDPWLTDLSSLVIGDGNSFGIIGLCEAEGKKPASLILINDLGEVGYVPMEWFGPGNG